MADDKKVTTITLPPPEDRVARQVHDEWTTGQRNNSEDDNDFEAIIDLLECRRSERDYEWMSDVFIPEYPSIHLTEASMWANQYFQSREFVEVYLEGDKPEDKVRADMVRKFINISLNMKEVYHYPKYMRLRSINSLRGTCVALCQWERMETPETYTEQVPIRDFMTNLPTGAFATETRQRQKIVTDRFNYEPIDPRNVVMDRKYTYTLQDKEYIILRDEVTYEDLIAEKNSKGYINLDKVKDLTAPVKTDTQKETTDKFESKETVDKPVFKKFDRLLRFGKMWSIVTKRAEDGYPVVTKPGYDDTGKVRDDAELVESIIEEVYTGSTKVLIRFQPTPYRTSKGTPFRPLIRGLCYIHPTKDVGMSDGKYSRELQVALNDTINMSNDRTKLATLPTFKGQENSITDNDQVFFEPEHIIPLRNVADLEEIQIKDNVKGALDQAGLFISGLQKVNAIYPTTMGELPGQASTTATAVAGADARSNLRANYKSLTFEYTFNAEFYWMMLQMAFQFMHPSTAIALWGESARLFDPDADYTYAPVSSNVEQEYNKDRKIQRWDSILGRIVAIPNPAIIPVISFIIGEISKLQGTEYQVVGKMLGQLASTPNTPEAGAAAPETAPALNAPPVSNQNNRPMLLQEQNVRGMSS